MFGFIWGGVCGFIQGVCVVLFGGHAWFYSGGHAWFYLGGHAWFYLGGMRGFIRGGHAWFFQFFRIQWDTVNERAVRILLECILVHKNLLIISGTHSNQILLTLMSIKDACYSLVFVETKLFTSGTQCRQLGKYWKCEWATMYCNIVKHDIKLVKQTKQNTEQITNSCNNYLHFSVINNFLWCIFQCTFDQYVFYSF